MLNKMRINNALKNLKSNYSDSFGEQLQKNCAIESGKTAFFNYRSFLSF